MCFLTFWIGFGWTNPSHPMYTSMDQSHSTKFLNWIWVELCNGIGPSFIVVKVDRNLILWLTWLFAHFLNGSLIHPFRFLHEQLQILGVNIIKWMKFPSLLTNELTTYHYIRRLKNRIRFFQFASNCLKGTFHDNWTKLVNMIKFQSFLLLRFNNFKIFILWLRDSWNYKVHKF